MDKVLLSFLSPVGFMELLVLGWIVFAKFNLLPPVSEKLFYTTLHSDVYTGGVRESHLLFSVA